LEKLQRLTDKVINFMLAICMIYVFIIAISCVLQVFSRYVLQATYTWTEETARFAWMSLGMLGIPVAYRYKSHVTIDIVATRLKGTPLEALRLAINFLVGFASIIYCTQGYKMLILLFGSKGTNMPNFPMEIVNITAPIGGGLCAWCCIMEILEILAPKPKEM
jgi:TRAP-type C4-dicarboxylate transport system permease small subunit